MAKKITMLGISLVAVALMITPTNAATFEIDGEVASADLYREIDKDAGQPGGTGGSLYLSDKSFGVIQFDLHHDAGEPIESVTSAEIQLVVHTHSDRSPAVFHIWRVTEAFDEADLRSFESGELPLHDSTVDPIVLTINPSDQPVNEPFRLPVSSLLENNGDMSTFGILMIRQTTGSNTRFYSSNYTVSSRCPRLFAEYSAVPEPGTMVLLAGVSTLMLRRKQ